MPFQKGHRLAKGGARPGAGRPSSSEIAIREQAKETFEQIIRRATGAIANHALARLYESDAVLNKLIDKFWPNESIELDQSPRSAVFIQFNNNPSQLPSETLPVTVLASDGDGEDKECSNGLASEVGKRQDSLKFLDFKNVPRK